MVTCSKRFLHHSGFCFDRAYTACVTGMINDAVGGDCPSGDGDFQVNQDNTGTMSIDFRSFRADSSALTWTLRNLLSFKAGTYIMRAFFLLHNESNFVMYCTESVLQGSHGVLEAKCSDYDLNQYGSEFSCLIRRW